MESTTFPLPGLLPEGLIACLKGQEAAKIPGATQQLTGCTHGPRA